MRGRCSSARSVANLKCLRGTASSIAKMYMMRSVSHQPAEMLVRLLFVAASMITTHITTANKKMKKRRGGIRLINNLFQKSFVFDALRPYAEKNKQICMSCDSSH